MINVVRSENVNTHCDVNTAQSKFVSEFRRDLKPSNYCDNTAGTANNLSLYLVWLSFRLATP